MLRCYVPIVTLYESRVHRIACRSPLFTARPRVTIHRGLTISRRGPPWVSGTLPSRNAARQIADLRLYADKLVTDSHHSLEILPSSLFLFFCTLYGWINPSAISTRPVEWKVGSRMARALSEGRESAYFFFFFLRTGGPNRPVSSAVCRRLTENASRHHEESGPTDKRPEGTDNPCRIAASARLGSAQFGQHLRSGLESSGSLRKHAAVLRSPSIDSVPVASRVYGETSV